MSLCLIDVHGDIEGDFEWVEELPRITNGDVIKALFPYIRKYDNILLDGHSKNILFDDSWWNSPYAKGEITNSKGVLEQIAEEQKTLLDTTKAWSKALEHGDIY